MKLEYKVNEPKKYENIYQVLKCEFGMSKRLITRLKKSSKIYCNNNTCNLDTKLIVNDNICVDISFKEECENIFPTKMELNILYEDEAFIAINKSANTPVHPSINHFEDSLSNGLKYYFGSIGLKRKIRPINRLDKDTTGIVLFAKNEYIQECLIKQMANNIFKKEYIAILEGTLTSSHIDVVAPIARKEESIIERCVNSHGEYAETIIDLIKCYEKYSLVKCRLMTGKTHQIRVHTKHIGFPILGDTLYGTSSNFISRQALHAYKVSFIHPITKQNIILTAPLPDDMQKLI